MAIDGLHNNDPFDAVSSSKFRRIPMGPGPTSEIADGTTGVADDVLAMDAATGDRMGHAEQPGTVDEGLVSLSGIPRAAAARSGLAADAHDEDLGHDAPHIRTTGRKANRGPGYNGPPNRGSNN